MRNLFWWKIFFLPKKISKQKKNPNKRELQFLLGSKTLDRKKNFVEKQKKIYIFFNQNFFFDQKFFSYQRKFPNKQKIPSPQKNLPTKKVILLYNFAGGRKKMKLIVKISINKNQHQSQMKKTVETQTECETDDKIDIEFVRISPLHPRERLKRKVEKINYS